ncbi:hypothetical protein COMNV_01521 [Commensalibacter sp. Nvir]|uniref:OmpA family protein n=1 Tax=Commensalibacter sp. Nvir TaxID=3069817 RepID=UPI002D34509B|nr:hypothetical protein COMNV_01521 [Commensalibacter sp. Nvir]
MYNNLKIVLLSTGLFYYFSSPVFSQVTVNPSALDTLSKPAENSNKSAPKRNTKRNRPRKKNTDNPETYSKKPVIQQNSAEKTNSSSTPIIPSIPQAPPPIPVIKQQDLNVPLHPPAPPPMPKIIENARGSVKVSPIKTIILFNNEDVDLNKDMMKAVIEFAKSLKSNPNVQAYLYAYSHESPDDPSTPRRIALERGLSIRSVLINQGIASTRIYLMVKGTTKLNNSIPQYPDSVELWRSNQLDSTINKP